MSPYRDATPDAGCEAVVHLVGIIQGFPARADVSVVHTQRRKNLLRAVKRQRNTTLYP